MTSTVQVRFCEVCGTKLSGRGPAKLGICFRCRQDGSAFAAAWALDLRTAGADPEAIVYIVGYSSQDAMRARLSDRRRAAGRRETT